MNGSPTPHRGRTSYDYLLKFLLVGDSDVGKGEILGRLDDETIGTYTMNGVDHKVTTILLDGKRVRLELWDTSGQGRFCTILRSYSRGAQGILLVYDITSRWSFDGINRWIKEIDEHAPGVPKILIGNRLHLAYKRQVSSEEAQIYAIKNDMEYFEVSSLCDYNVTESLTELSRVVLNRNGMERLWRTNKVLSLQDYCCRVIVNCTSTYTIDKLPLPPQMRSRLKSFADANHMYRYMLPPLDVRLKKRRTILNATDPPFSSRKSCIIS
ncbi:ras-related protein Rab-40C-like isoform X1 [Asterias rubens]|uniref:ras-related protein Rab-40C-like n=1 Tax=Asterias amurensis TaxID=7602 RepID=UPI001455098C|nr:ras-related protein Rab-40C-like isoform X1 [Asterias rubens]